MKRKIKRCLSLFLVIVMALVSMPVWSEPEQVEAATHKYVDYSRIYGSKTGQEYEVELSYSFATLPGTLRYTGSYTQEEIDDAIDRIFFHYGMDEGDLKYAQECIEKWNVKSQFTAADAMHIANNVAKMLDLEVGKPLDAANEIFQFAWDNQDSKETITNLSINIAKAYDAEVYERIYRTVCGFFSQFKTLEDIAVNMAGIQFDLLNEKGITLAKWSVPHVKIINMIVNCTEVFIDEWKRDKAKWKDRVEAVNAARLLECFYEAVNDYLQRHSPKNQNWVLTVAGSQKRYFNFFGSDGNVQWITLGLSASKNKISNFEYITRSDKTNYPYGIYTGAAVIDISHNLSNFDYDFWNLPIGIMKKNWLNDLISASFGGELVAMEDSTYIQRKLYCEQFSFYIPGGFSYQYNSTIPATVGNCDVVTTIDMECFTDKVFVEATHTLDYQWGFVNVQDGDKVTAYDYVGLKAHAEMENGDLRLIFDDTKALVWIAGETFADVNEQNMKGGTAWDENIWDDMDRGIRIKVKFR